MANDILLATGVIVVWGTDGVTHASGIVTSYTEAKGAKEKALPGADGITKALVKYDKTIKGTLEIVAKPDATIPEVGAAIAVGGITAGIVDSVRQIWQVEDFKKLSIEITKYESVTPDGGGS